MCKPRKGTERPRTIREIRPLIHGLVLLLYNLRATIKMQVDVSSPTGKLMLTMLAGFAEFGREIMLERQRAGIEMAKRAGKYKGRVRKYTEKHKGMQYAIKLAKERAQNGMSIREICEITQVSRFALYRELQKERELNIQ